MAPGEGGALIIELDNDGTPLTLCAFRRRRGADRSDIWHIADVCELRGIDPLEPLLFGEIQGDGSFNFYGVPDHSSRPALIAFVEATDPRLHFEEDDPYDLDRWVFE